MIYNSSLLASYSDVCKLSCIDSESFLDNDSHFLVWDVCVVNYRTYRIKSA